MANGKKKKGGARSLVILTVLLVLLLAAAAATLYIYKGAEKDKVNFKANAEAAANEATQKQEAEWQSKQAEVDAYNASLGVVVTPAPVASGWDVVDMSQYEMKNPTYITVDRTSLILGGGILVNYWHSIPSDLPEDQLVSVQNYLEKRWQVSATSVSVFPVAANALDKMFTAAKAEGVENFIVEEGYRTMEKQQASWDKEKALSKYANYSGDALNQLVNKVVSMPGTSEYQSGFAVCIQRYLKGDSEFNKSFAGTEHSNWLINNSWKYGFVFRYPIAGYPASDTIDKSYITGRSNKLSIYRYVGVANAAVMHTKDWCMEEYYEYLTEHPHLMVYENGQLRYEVIRVKYDGGINASVPVNAACNAYEITMDNLGGIIIAMTFNP